MSEREGDPITVDLLPGGFEAVQGVVAGMDIAFQAVNGPETERLSVTQRFAILQQVAAEGILDLLGQANLSGAAALTAELKEKTAANPYTDLTAVEISAQNRLHDLTHELEGHQRALAEYEAQKHKDAIHQLEEQITRERRYERLAAAVGATARATVAVVTGNDERAAQASLARERKIVETAAEPLEVNGMVRLHTAIGTAAQSALGSMLDKLENPPLAQIR